MERAEQSKKAFIKQLVRSVRAATEGASEAQGGNGTGTGRWDSREDEILEQRYAERPRAPMTRITANSKLTIKSRNCVRHLNLRKSGYSVADETIFLVSFLVLLQPHAHFQPREIHAEKSIEIGLNTSSVSRSRTENASRPSRPQHFSATTRAIELTKHHQYHARTKHIDIHFHFLRWVTEQNSIKIIYCPTDDMLADTLTKALPS